MSDVPRDMSGADLTADAQAKRAVKRPGMVDVVFAEHDGVLGTREGDVAYRAGDAILTGPLGERWPVPRGAFLDSYDPEEPIRAGEAGRYRKRPTVVLARRITAPFSVRVGDGDDRLRGQPGDWLLQYAPGRHGIVSADVFDETYVVLGDSSDV
jgi:hypothetical protein